MVGTSRAPALLARLGARATTIAGSALVFGAGHLLPRLVDQVGTGGSVVWLADFGLAVGGLGMGVVLAALVGTVMGSAPDPRHAGTISRRRPPSAGRQRPRRRAGRHRLLRPDQSARSALGWSGAFGANLVLTVTTVRRGLAYVPAGRRPSTAAQSVKVAKQLVGRRRRGRSRRGHGRRELVELRAAKWTSATGAQASLIASISSRARRVRRRSSSRWRSSLPVPVQLGDDLVRPSALGDRPARSGAAIFSSGRCARLQHRARVPSHLVGTVAVGLVDDLLPGRRSRRIPALAAWMPSPMAPGAAGPSSCRRARRSRPRLTPTHGLDQDHVAAGGVEDAPAPAAWSTPARQVAARGHGRM